MGAHLQPGQTVGRHRIVRELGSGAMGAVYLAQDPQIDRLLAIKVVRPEAARPSELEDRKRRLLREAKAAGRLIHPHIVTLFDAGEEAGLLYLAFEYVKGWNLAERLDCPPRPSLAEALKIAREVCEGLDFAHRQAIVHRDIKPGNILLDEERRVKISDFGIAKMVGQTSDLTVSGTVIGSPSYLSPEQIRGEELDGRSDLFSLGVVLYELLADQRPFQGETLTTLVYQILHHEPPSLAAVRPDLPQAVQDLVRRLLAKDREERFPSAREVATELSALERTLPSGVLESEPVPISLPTSTYRIPTGTQGEASASAFSTVKASRSWLLAGSGLLLLTAAVAVGLLVVRPWVTEPGDSLRSPAVESSEPMTSQESSASPVAVEETKAAPPAGTRPEPAEQVPEAPAVEPPERAPRQPAEAAKEPVPGPSRTQGSESAAPPAEPVPMPPRRQAPPEPAPTTETSPEQPSTTGAPAPAPQAEPSIPPRVRSFLRRHPGAVQQRTETGLSLRFDVTPEDAFVLLDGKVLGRASEWSGASSLRLPSAGDHVIILRRTGMLDYFVLVRARAELTDTRVVAARLEPIPAAEQPLTQLERYAVREAVAFNVEPPYARLFVGGKLAGPAARYSGKRGAASWLRLDDGVHRISLMAPGHRRVDFVVEVGRRAKKQRQTIRIRLASER